jgi:hypothetical protein
MDSTKTALPELGKADVENITMSFAYIEGEEAQALSYYEKRLMASRDPNERSQLETLVRNLRAEMEKTNQPHIDFSLSSLSLKCV